MLLLAAMACEPNHKFSPGYRVFELPPPHYHVEWQVMLDSSDDTTVTWGAYSPYYQKELEAVFRSGRSGITYQPGQTQEYCIDFIRMLQIRTSCSEGWGSERRVRRVFVPDDMPEEAGDSNTTMTD